MRCVGGPVGVTDRARLVQQDGMLELERLFASAVRLHAVTLLTRSAGVDGEPHDAFFSVPRRGVYERALGVTRFDEWAPRIEPFEHDGFAAETGQQHPLAI